jgi:pyridoxamine-phosphate oxidase
MKDSDIRIFSPDPFEQFNELYKVFVEGNSTNYNAMTLASSSAKGRVSARIVLLKYYNKDGFVFYTNYLSKKGVQINENRNAALLFYWPELGRQIRIEGEAEKVSPEESDEYFSSRIKGHQINALVSKQSKEIPNRDSLIKNFNKLIQKYKNADPVRPLEWGGYRLKPSLFEFWQESENRLNDRIEYRLIKGKWQIRQLAP